MIGGPREEEESNDGTDPTKVLGRVARSEEHSVSRTLPTQQQQIGEYTIDATLGEGGFSTVYAAHHTVAQYSVALKVLHRRWCMVPQIVARFLREAEVVQRIDHPNIVALREVGWIDGGWPFLVMERLDGTSLGRILNQRGSLPVPEVLDYFEPMCDALGAAHRSGIVHRDLKPSNVMVSHPGEPFWLKLIDFGIAKLVTPEAPRLTRTGSQVGTMTAMSPEQILGHPIDWRADIYALGVLLYQSVTGQRPFVGSMVTLEQMHLHAPVPRASWIAPVGPAIDRVIMRCMQKDPDRRYLSCDTFLIDLRAAVEDSGADAVLSIRPDAERPGLPGVAPVAAPAVAPEPSAVKVVGLYAEVLVDGQTVDWDALDDDDALDDIEQIVEQAVARAQADGHVLALRSSSAVMACLAVGDGGDEQATMERVVTAARALASELRTREAPSERVEIAMYLDIGEVERSGTGAGQTLSGPFIETRPWLASPPIPGTWMSRNVVDRVMGLTSEAPWCRLKDD